MVLGHTSNISRERESNYV